jgi:hypothetical protein
MHRKGMKSVCKLVLHRLKVKKYLKLFSNHRVFVKSFCQFNGEFKGMLKSGVQAPKEKMRRVGTFFTGGYRNRILFIHLCLERE